MISSENNYWPDADRLGYALIPLFAAFIVYINSFRGAFQLDDYNVIVFNSAVHSWSAFWKGLFPGIRPVLKLTYTLNWTSPASIAGFHAFNLAVHLVNTFLVYRLTVSFMRECRPGSLEEKALYPAALLTALLFALHPIQTEAVTYISGRSSSLMTAFYLGSVAAYVRGARDGRKIWLYCLSPLLFLLSIATKEYAATLPFALVLYEAAVRGGEGVVRKIVSRQWIHWMLLMFIAAMVLAQPRYRFILLYSFGLRGLRENMLGQASAAGELLFHIIMPNRLNIDPGELSAVPVLSAQIFTMIILVFLAVFGILRKKAWLFFGIFWFFLGIFPIILIPRIDAISDRHFYHGGWGIFLITAVIITSLFFRRFQSFRSFAILLTCIAVFLGGFTMSRNHMYRSEIALWEDTVKKSPSNARAYNNLGYAYYLSGREADARQAYLRALAIDPGLEHARNNLGMLVGKDTPAGPQRYDEK